MHADQTDRKILPLFIIIGTVLAAYLLSAEYPGIPLAIVVFALPVGVFLYAVWPSRRIAKDDSDLYCFGGLNRSRVVTSTVGSVLATSSLMNATVGGVGYGGSAPLWAAIVAVPIFCTAFLYFLVTSKRVREYFSDPNGQPLRTRTIIGFIASNNGPSVRWFVLGIIILMLFGLLFVEMGFLFLWGKQLLSDRVTTAWPLVAFWLVLCFAYVYIGGYLQVLRTDWLQFFILLTILAVATLFFLYELFPEARLGSALHELFANFVDRNHMEFVVSWRPVTEDEVIWFNLWAGIGAFLLVGVWFVVAPDIWNRFAQSFYVGKNFGDDRVKARVRLGIAFAVIGFFIAIFDLFTGYIGIVTFKEIRDIMTGEILPTGLPFAAVEHHFEKIAGAGNVTFTLSLLIVLVSVATLTTLDTLIITFIQSTRDAVQRADATPRFGAVPSLRWIGLGFFGAAFATTLGTFIGWDRPAMVVATTAVATVICVPLGISLLFILINRIFLPHWMKGRDRFVILFHFVLFTVSTVTWGSLIFGGVTIWGYGIERIPGATVGKIYVIEIVIYLSGFVLYGLARTLFNNGAVSHRNRSGELPPKGAKRDG